jgi:hypothetical protein
MLAKRVKGIFFDYTVHKLRRIKLSYLSILLFLCLHELLKNGEDFQFQHLPQFKYLLLILPVDSQLLKNLCFGSCSSMLSQPFDGIELLVEDEETKDLFFLMVVGYSQSALSLEFEQKLIKFPVVKRVVIFLRVLFNEIFKYQAQQSGIYLLALGRLLDRVFRFQGDLFDRGLDRPVFVDQLYEIHFVYDRGSNLSLLLSKLRFFVKIEEGVEPAMAVDILNQPLPLADCLPLLAKIAVFSASADSSYLQ